LVEVPWARHVSFAECEEYAASVPAGSVVATPLRSAPFCAEIAELRLDDVVLRTGSRTPLMSTGGPDADSVWIVLPLGAPGTLMLQGRAVEPGDVAVYGPGATDDQANLRNTRWALVALPAKAAEALLEPRRGSPLRRPGASAVLRVDRKQWTRAASLARAASEVAAQDPEVFEVAEARRSLRAEVLEVLRGLLAGGPRRGACARALPATPARRRIVMAVEDHIRADPGRPVDVEDLCAALGVSPSRLRSAFAASFSITPDQYLRLRRLALARAAMRSAEPRWTSVEEVAAAHGFWDVGCFASEYHELFGEAPSATFRRSVE
jgi:AraC-like DNA-binding protein